MKTASTVPGSIPLDFIDKNRRIRTLKGRCSPYTSEHCILYDNCPRLTGVRYRNARVHKM